MIKQLGKITILATLASCAFACGTEGAAGPCAQLEDRLQQCFGDASAEAYAASTCDEAAAATMPRDCIELAVFVAEGKADDMMDEAIRDAVRTGIEEGIRQGVDVALQAVMDGLGLELLDDRAYYFQLALEDTQAAADSRAEELRVLLAAEPTMDPVVVETSSGFVVFHGPCPFDFYGEVGDWVASLIVGYPSLIEDLGGQVTTVMTDEGAQSRVSIPMSIWPMPLTMPDELGCIQ